MLSEAAGWRAAVNGLRPALSKRPQHERLGYGGLVLGARLNAQMRIFSFSPGCTDRTVALDCSHAKWDDAVACVVLRITSWTTQMPTTPTRSIIVDVLKQGIIKYGLIV